MYTPAIEAPFFVENTNKEIQNHKRIVYRRFAIWVFLLGLVLYAQFAPTFKDRLNGQLMFKRSRVLSNMQDWHKAALDYAEAHQGFFPKKSAELRNYFHQANSVNPFTNEPQWPIEGNIKSVSVARKRTGEFIGKGVIEYSVIFDSLGFPSSFAIRGGDEDGKAISDRQGGTFVFSNQ